MLNFNDLHIFELANNHQGDVSHGINIINKMGEIARKHRINAAVKLQYRQLDTFIHPDYRNDKDAKHISRFLTTELSKEQFHVLVKAIRENEMTTICTPFDEESVDVILDHKIEVIKIASCSADDWPLLQKISATKKPVIASTGGLSTIQIDNLVSFFTNRIDNFALLHCVGIYPSPNNTLNLRFLQKLIKRYPNVIIGYSGHEEPENTDVIKVAVSLGARIFERHVGIATDTIKLNNYSMNPDQVDSWIQAANSARDILGNYEKHVTSGEQESLLSLKRGVFAKKAIKKGDPISAEDVFFAMPCSSEQLTSGDFGTLRAKYTATKDYQINEAISEHAPPDKYKKLRQIIHDARGMLSEAGVILSNEAEVELSHHYGIEKFHEYGCLIVNVLNREYCKKVIIVFPGQKHPEQYHLQKEETFHILKGDLIASINGIDRHLFKGDILVIERGDKHAFTTNGGCIIEEVSTTHFRNDSFYTDASIAEQDPMARKTILEKF